MPAASASPENVGSVFLDPNQSLLAIASSEPAFLRRRVVTDPSGPDPGRHYRDGERDRTADGRPQRLTLTPDNTPPGGVQTSRSADSQ
jgi:hypothetical protein